MPVSNSPQAQRLADRLPPQPPADATQPRVLIPGALKLSREQEDALINHVIRRKQDLSASMGLRDYSTESWATGGVGSDGAFNRRYLDTQQMGLDAYAMRYEWRPTVKGGIFAESNLHIPLTRRIVQQQIARLVAYFTGTEPYYSAYDVGAEDEEVAEKLEKWIRHVLDSENNTKADLDAALERACVCSAAIMALSYEKRYTYYQAFKSVLMDPDTGKPLVSQVDGDYIIEGEDEFIAPPQPTQTDELGNPIAAPVVNTGLMVLKRDGTTPAPATMVFEEQLIWRRILSKEGPKAELLMPADFLFPLNAKSLDEADILWHRVSEKLIELVDRYSQAENVPPEERINQVNLMLARLMPSTTNTEASAAKTGRSELGESQSDSQGTGSDHMEPVLNLDRVCLHYDANMDGAMEDIYLIMTEDGYPIVYDYVANFTPDARRPYRRLRVNPVAGRVHGQGSVELYEHLQTNCDLLLNRWNFSQSGSGRVTFWNPQLTLEGQADPSLTLNNGATYTPASNDIEVARILQYVHLPELKGVDLKQMIEFLMQIAMNMSGVTNVNDAGMVGLDTSKLATGVRNLEASSQELFGKYIADLSPDVRDIIRSLALLAIANMGDNPKVFKFFNGDLGVLTTINHAEVRNVNLDVSIELTKYKGEQTAAQSASAIQAATGFYALTPVVQQRLAPLYRQQLKSYQIKNADEIIMPLSPEEMLPPPGAAPVAGTDAATPPTSLV